MFYWIIVFIWSIFTVYYFDKQSNKNISLVDTKGTLKEKTYVSIKMILVFLLPYLFTLGNKEFFFDTFCVIVSLAMFCELFLLDKQCKKFNLILMLLVVLSFIILPQFYVKIIDYNKILFCALVISLMDTFMNIIGKHIVSKLANFIPVFKYPKSVSGNKTVLSVILSLLLNVFIFSYLFEITILSIYDVIIISLLTAIGDAVFSVYKRNENIQDFSNLLGKIGGFCDRFDGWVLPFIYIFLM